MINDSEQELIRLQSELITHEVQCEERWKTTFNRLEDIEASLLRMENRQMQLGGAVIVFLATIVATMVIQG